MRFAWVSQVVCLPRPRPRARRGCERPHGRGCQTSSRRARTFPCSRQPSIR
jgi:hypothetical protein